MPWDAQPNQHPCPQVPVVPGDRSSFWLCPSQGFAALVVLAQNRRGAHLRLTRRIMLWLFFFFFLSVLFFVCLFLVRVSIFASEIYFSNLKYYIHTLETT